MPARPEQEGRDRLVEDELAEDQPKDLGAGLLLTPEEARREAMVPVPSVEAGDEKKLVSTKTWSTGQRRPYKTRSWVRASVTPMSKVSETS